MANKHWMCGFGRSGNHQISCQILIFDAIRKSKCCSKCVVLAVCAGESHTYWHIQRYSVPYYYRHLLSVTHNNTIICVVRTRVRSLAPRLFLSGSSGKSFTRFHHWLSTGFQAVSTRWIHMPAYITIHFWQVVVMIFNDSGTEDKLYWLTVAMCVCVCVYVPVLWCVLCVSAVCVCVCVRVCVHVYFCLSRVW